MTTLEKNVVTKPVLLDVQHLSKSFVRSRDVLGRPRETVRAVRDISVGIRAGETLGIVGESGSGKSTLGRSILRLENPEEGSVLYQGKDLLALGRRELRRTRRDLQMIFQDPYASLDPTKTVGNAISEPLRIYDRASRADHDDQVAELLTKVGLRTEFAMRYPGEMSGGQRQRVAIARALALDPKVIVADEAVSALDVSTQSEVINLLVHLNKEFDLTCLFISHNLGVVRHISDRIAVMYLGRIVELGSAAEVYDSPRHPYTKALLSAIPVPDPVIQRARPKTILEGDSPDPAHPPTGCAFASRCPYAQEVCTRIEPNLERRDNGSVSACHFADSIIREKDSVA
ncbi:ATP-binding cassette domain-containing protein [Rhodococcus sp. BP-252]|uniref:ABC transporter ATP-binding protein n=1 Tax=unclassified Rhodococcus (in: high G+C Gram-positive bacteria) TaxID=192944 RepID=UPI001DF630F7|nr:MULTISPECIES: oligopeptide/dipeptide ABC transporter ATP-binding protein [unclassified Rhodococcus (in: high G+C Gram-positive bacteria)]MBY6410833.1 ATP-binding cassette domain-containing protein [Rhodococcus sp. BP-320]MBY6415342.1 ATP-binding cassette domain-containing protein [Rhodococcus sp. BP-321]MBY6419957.1 ATP-binding cassette domain-containing protein [Rhodococcus sp. BP-324]MBY6425389.1 ATP-binding cassette domain-containing protein [Rhodococcus sp. BP-323]MBY6430548.1 ATP-bindi